MSTDYSKVITFDGTSGSGKGTIAKIIADHYGYKYLDTGKLYRALALLILIHSKQGDYLHDLGVLIGKINQELLSKKDLYTEDVTNLSSKIAANPEVRKSLLSFQRNFANSTGGAVLDGRDTGSIICPEAENKFYIDADLTIRSKRRYLQNKEFYDKVNMGVSDIEKSLFARDKQDKEREIAPLIVPDGAHVIDNSKDDLETVIKNIKYIIDY